MTTIREVADAYVEARAAHEPAAAQALGTAAGDRLPDLSPEWLIESDELTRRVRRDAEHASTPATSDVALRAALIERADAESLLFDAGFTSRLLAPLASPIHAVRESFDNQVVTDDEAGDMHLARLAQVPTAVDQLIERLRWSRAAGSHGRFVASGVAGQRQIRVVADQLDSWIDPQRLDIFGSMQAGPGLSSSRAAALSARADAATRAFARFSAFLREDLLPSAPPEDAVGAEVYERTARSFLGTAIDLEEIYDFGWTEIERLKRRTRGVVEEITGVRGASLFEARTLLDRDPSSRLRGPRVLENWLRERVQQSIDASAAVFDLPESIGEVDCVVTEAAATGVVHYLPAAPDGSSRSRIVWMIPAGADSVSTWQEVTTVHHEGAPGHHLEHAVNAANTALHPWQRHLCEVHGYAEGWAHYAEGLSEEIGLVHSPAERLGVLLGMMWRSVRIVADVGLHTGKPVPRAYSHHGERWTPEMAVRMLSQLALVEPSNAAFEVDRYFGWPGQALAFKVGAKLWEDARLAAQRRDGDAFSLRAFHARALSQGPMGLAPLQELVLG